MSDAALNRPNIVKDLRLTPQAKLVLAHLGRRKSITPLEALGTYNISRLASCINEMRRVGYSVRTELRKDERGHGYARYSLASQVH
jgi:hypothetical protein